MTVADTVLYRIERSWDEVIWQPFRILTIHAS